jgi:hypothetical protein
MSAGGLVGRLRDRARNRLRQVRDRADKLDAVQFGLRGLLLPRQVQHVSGVARPRSDPDDVIVISVMRNGMPWLQSFLARHRQIGVRHFAIIDNGSTDGTSEYLAAQPDVTLLYTEAPYSAYENTMKRYLAQNYAAGRWCLCVDVDELFEYPFMDRVSLANFVRYLDQHGANAVITQMLDMFSDVPLNRIQSQPEDDLKQTYRWYDLAGIWKAPYGRGVPGEHLAFHRGGIRHTVFGTTNGLTKVSFFKMDGRVRPFVDWHHVDNGRIADVTAVLLHFPFVTEFYTKVADAVATGRYGYLTSNEYVRYGAGLGKAGDLHLKQETSKIYTAPERLLEDDFLYASPNYRRFAGAERADT